MDFFRMISIVLLTAVLTVSAAAESPYVKPDGSYITITGTVVATSDNAFELDYGQGIVLVEMDDWDWYEEGQALIVGDEVTVYGVVDDDLYETTSIEAGSVYVQDLNTYFYASTADEESIPMYNRGDHGLQLTGEVSKVDGREFYIDTGKRRIKVDTRLMSYNPMDDKGYQRVDKGDWVTVAGDIDYDLFNKRELKAETIITLADNSAPKEE